MKKNKRGTRLLFIILLAALFIFIGATTAVAQNVTVTANPLWTNTGVYVDNGDTVSIAANGQWTLANGFTFFGPGGTNALTNNTFLYEAYWGQLIAFIGTDPYQGHWGDKNFFPQHNGSGYWAIGSNKTFFSDRSGYLWLGFNDDAVSKNTFDNYGSVTASINVHRDITIDVIPGKIFNAIDLSKNKKIPVAVFGSSTFDVTTIDRSSISLTEAHALPNYKLKDLNGDGYLDMILYFDTKSLFIDDERIYLTGRTISGRWIVGSDSYYFVKRGHQ